MKQLKKINYLIVHHSESNGGDIVLFENYHKEHNNWPHVGYHYVIPRDSSIQNILGEEVQGIHCPGRNDDSLAICLVGSEDSPPTVNQIKAAVILILHLMGKYGVPCENVLGHIEGMKLAGIAPNGRTCPGSINMPTLRQVIKNVYSIYKRYATLAMLQAESVVGPKKA